MKIEELFKLELAIEIIEKLGYPVFSKDIGKDERDEHSSFFIFFEEGQITRGKSPNQYLREFILTFITKVDDSINEIELVENLKKTGLVFRGSTPNYGKIADTGEDAMTIDFTFVRTVRACC